MSSESSERLNDHSNSRHNYLLSEGYQRERGGRVNTISYLSVCRGRPRFQGVRSHYFSYNGWMAAGVSLARLIVWYTSCSIINQFDSVICLDDLGEGGGGMMWGREINKRQLDDLSNLFISLPAACSLPGACSSLQFKFEFMRLLFNFFVLFRPCSCERNSLNASVGQAGREESGEGRESFAGGGGTPLSIWPAACMRDLRGRISSFFDSFSADKQQHGTFLLLPATGGSRSSMRAKTRGGGGGCL